MGGHLAYELVEQGIPPADLMRQERAVVGERRVQVHTPEPTNFW
jgi:hypothetical protein